MSAISGQPTQKPAVAAVNVLADGQQPQQQQQVASLDPSIGMAQTRQVPLAQGQAASTSPQAQRVLAALTSPQSMTGGAPMGMQQQGGNQPAAPVQVAQAGPDMSQLPVMAGGASDAIQPGKGPSLQQLYQAAQNPWLNETQRAIISNEIERQQQAADPLRQMQIKKLEREIATPQKNWQKLDDTHLFDPASGEIKEVSGGGARPGGFRFKGTSVEAQSLNGLMDAGQLTEDQAQQLGAGKTVTDPQTGAILFMTPQGVFGQSPRGGPPQPVAPAQGGGSQLFSPQPLGGLPAAPGAMPQNPAQPQQTAPDAQRQGMIQLTDPKAIRPTDTQRNRVSNVNQAFDTITSELDRFANLVDKTGVEVMPGKEKDNLNTVRQGIMLQMKELFNLGVLNGPDLQLMENMIYDPVIDPMKEGGLSNLPGQLYAGATGSAGDRAKNSVRELKRMLENIKSSAQRSIAPMPGGQTVQTPPPPNATGGGTVDWRTYFGGQ
jgi:hypothetical protein